MKVKIWSNLFRPLSTFTVCKGTRHDGKYTKTSPRVTHTDFYIKLSDQNISHIYKR